MILKAADCMHMLTCFEAGWVRRRVPGFPPESRTPVLYMSESTVRIQSRAGIEETFGSLEVWGLRRRRCCFEEAHDDIFEMLQCAKEKKVLPKPLPRSLTHSILLYHEEQKERPMAKLCLRRWVNYGFQVVSVGNVRSSSRFPLSSGWNR